MEKIQAIGKEDKTWVMVTCRNLECSLFLPLFSSFIVPQNIFQ